MRQKSFLSEAKNNGRMTVPRLKIGVDENSFY